MNDDFNMIPSDWTPDNAIIKVIGVGGGGCNAVSYMYKQKIQGCSFIVCNTDPQSLSASAVPVKIRMGDLGAGTDPIEGRNAALESQDVIKEKVIDNGTKMLFITAGMGGGTGTGASPVIAKLAKDAGILTVAVVTLPFKDNGNEALSKAIDGIRELEKNVDSMLLINNQKLYDVYGQMLLHEALPKADEVLATAVRGIIDIIQKRGYMNVDFKDVSNMMRESGMALMGTGTGSGPNRLEEAVKGAFESPLLNDFDLKTAKNVLVNITCSRNDKGLLMGDLEKIDKLISGYTGNANKFKTGLIYDDDPEADDTVRITAIATGFDMGRLSDITDVSLGNLIILDSDFTYQKNVEKGVEIELSATPSYTNIKIGFNTTENRCCFHFDEKPVLCVEAGENLAPLETVPAIRRAHTEKK